MEKCSACGAPLQNGVCPYCGAANTQASTHAPAAGAAAPVPAQPQVIVNQVTAAPYSAIDAPPKSKWVAFFLCLFLGYFGIHYFYTGKIGMGILYLLTLGLFGIGWIVDIVRILVGSFRDRYGRNLQG